VQKGVFYCANYAKGAIKVNGIYWANRI